MTSATLLKKLSIATVGATLAVLAAGESVKAAAVTVGSATPNTGNCFPFNCYGNGQYQQVYSSSAFSGPIDISKISFFNTEFQPGTAIISTANYLIRLSTTSKAVNGLESNFNNNLGANVTTFFNGILSGLTGTKFSIQGSNSFFYDPSGGNLLLDVTVSNNQGNGTGYLDVDLSGTQTSRVYNSNSGGNEWGLVTEFEDSKSVPEPLTLGGTALAGGIGLLIKKRKAASQQAKA